jgi:hypothetical protein
MREDEERAAVLKQRKREQEAKSDGIDLTLEALKFVGNNLGATPDELYKRLRIHLEPEQARRLINLVAELSPVLMKKVDEANRPKS